MDVARAEIIDYLRSVHSRPGGTAAVLNVFRAGKVRAGADIMVLTELVQDPALRRDLARHSMDEARHAYLLLRRMGELGTTPHRLPAELDRLEGLYERCRARDPKQVYNQRGTVDDAEMMEFMTVALIPEQDAVTKLRLNLEAVAHDPKTQTILNGILRDDSRHIEYLGAWLDRFVRRFSPRAVRATRERLVEVYRQLDLVYYGALRDYFDSVAPLAA
jgi:bacterioferritin (cytochrome b1)